MNGTVTISLELFDKLRTESEKATKLKEQTIQASKELEVFLSFLVTRENISEYLEEFNRQSFTSQIVISNGRAKIQINELED